MVIQYGPNLLKNECLVERKTAMSMSRTHALIGVPSSAGAHMPGQEKAPQYLRRAGLVARLEASGVPVVDYGDVPAFRFRPDQSHRKQQNLSHVVEIAMHTAEQVEKALQRQEIPLVIGGDCTITLGVITGFLRHGIDLGLLYFDGHIDLNTPATSTSGILDSMGLAYMIGEQGVTEELSHMGPRFPLMPEDKIVVFGYNPREMNDVEHDVLARHPMLNYPVTQVQGRVRHVATEALTQVEDRAQLFVVHFDVDVIDFVDFPIADMPQLNAGLTFRDAMVCLELFVSSPKFAGLIITEINPDHADEQGVLATAFVAGVAKALQR
jgi:arginase